MENEIIPNSLPTNLPINSTNAPVPERKFKKFAIILVIVILVAVSVVIFFLWRAKKAAPIVLSDAAKEQIIVEKEKQWKDNLNQTAAIDKDFDNLNDAEERQYGADPDNPDTDADGLLDGDEIVISKTNPLKADTDGDGIKDGREIKNGTDPLKK